MYIVKFEEDFFKNNTPWSYHNAFLVDTESVNIWKHNCIKTRLENKNPSVDALGYHCHFTPNTTYVALKNLVETSEFDMEELVVDIYNYFDWSTKWKDEQHDHAHFCVVAYHNIRVCQHIGTICKHLLNEFCTNIQHCVRVSSLVKNLLTTSLLVCKLSFVTQWPSCIWCLCSQGLIFSCNKTVHVCISFMMLSKAILRNCLIDLSRLQSSIQQAMCWVFALKVEKTNKQIMELW